MASSIHKFFVISGLLALLHAAYSAAQHRTYIRLTEQEFTVLPADILLQCLAGLIITIYGVVNVAGSFRDIRAAGDTENKTWETSQNRPSFYIFNHRGRHLFGDYEGSEYDEHEYYDDQKDNHMKIQ